jgi:hypothetical protein
MSLQEDWSFRVGRWRIPWEGEFSGLALIVRGSIDAQAERVCSM